jgi:hypothetical protein
MLRDFRDRYLLTNALGKAIVGLYYEFGPPMAGIIAKNEALRAVARVGLYPLVGSKYVTFHFSQAGNIVLFLVILAAAGNIILIIGEKKQAVLTNKVFPSHRADYPRR